jgi:UDP-N-acetylmuramate--alanine ligase
MERKGVMNGATVYDDYGHHPDEIRATLSGAREMGYRRILCAYQPHTYSRTAGLFEEFCTAFSDADRVYLADIYAAREQNIYGVSSELLAARIGDGAEYCGSFCAVADALARDARKGDLVIVMGAGDIYKVFELMNFS